MQIANINLGDKASISKKEEKESIFDKSLDEIVYFFESTTYDTVFIEDLTFIVSYASECM